MRYRKKDIGKNEGMVQAGDLFAKYRAILKAPESSVIQTFIEVIDDLFGWPLKKEQILYNPNTKIISLQVSGVLKSELQLHKKDILTHLKGRLGPKSAPKDIL